MNEAPKLVETEEKDTPTNRLLAEPAPIDSTSALEMVKAMRKVADVLEPLAEPQRTRVVRAVAILFGIELG